MGNVRSSISFTVIKWPTNWQHSEIQWNTFHRWSWRRQDSWCRQPHSLARHKSKQKVDFIIGESLNGRVFGIEENNAGQIAVSSNLDHFQFQIMVVDTSHLCDQEFRGIFQVIAWSVCIELGDYIREFEVRCLLFCSNHVGDIKFFSRRLCMRRELLVENC